MTLKELLHKIARFNDGTYEELVDSRVGKATLILKNPIGMFREDLQVDHKDIKHFENKLEDKRFRMLIYMSTYAFKYLPFAYIDKHMPDVNKGTTSAASNRVRKNDQRPPKNDRPGRKSGA